jgi:hypothetical protein
MDQTGKISVFIATMTNTAGRYWENICPEKSKKGREKSRPSVIPSRNCPKIVEKLTKKLRR